MPVPSEFMRHGGEIHDLAMAMVYMKNDKMTNIKNSEKIEVMALFRKWLSSPALKPRLRMVMMFVSRRGEESYRRLLRRKVQVEAASPLRKGSEIGGECCFTVGDVNGR